MTSCVVEAWLPANDNASELFDCSTEPFLPGLWIRTPMFSLLGEYCLEVASDFASCSVTAF